MKNKTKFYKISAFILALVLLLSLVSQDIIGAVFAEETITTAETDNASEESDKQDTDTPTPDSDNSGTEDSEANNTSTDNTDIDNSSTEGLETGDTSVADSSSSGSDTDKGESDTGKSDSDNANTGDIGTVETVPGNTDTGNTETDSSETGKSDANATLDGTVQTATNGNQDNANQVTEGSKSDESYDWTGMSDDDLKSWLLKEDNKDTINGYLSDETTRDSLTSTIKDFLENNSSNLSDDDINYIADNFGISIATEETKTDTSSKEVKYDWEDMDTEAFIKWFTSDDNKGEVSQILNTDKDNATDEEKAQYDSLYNKVKEILVSEETNDQIEELKKYLTDNGYSELFHLSTVPTEEPVTSWKEMELEDFANWLLSEENVSTIKEILSIDKDTATEEQNAEYELLYSKIEELLKPENQDKVDQEKIKDYLKEKFNLTFDTDEEEEYPWKDMTLKEFMEWFMLEENAELIKEIISMDPDDENIKPEDLAKYNSLYARVEEMIEARTSEDEEIATLAKKAYAYLLQLQGLYADTKIDGKYGDYIYFDLNAGNVTINDSTYKGYVYKDGQKTTVSGSHDKDNQYYIYQSTEANKSITGIIKDEIVLPEYKEIDKIDGKSWSDYITNNSSVEDVINNWNNKISATGRTATNNKIEITNTSATVVIDNLYSTYESNNKSDGPIKITGLNGKTVTLKLKGDSRFKNIYYNNSSNNGSKLVIESAAGDESTIGSMTVGSLVTTMIIGNNAGQWPDCLAVIGAADYAEYGLTFSGGTVFAGFPSQTNRVWNNRESVDFATCVGGGNNKSGEVTIKGGRLTAVTNGTSPAIGGGGGYKLTGDPGYVNISGGEVYAYSFGIYSINSEYEGFVPTTTIGGATTFNGTAKDGTKVNITGGYVFAQSVGGTAIGGGGSRNGTGGDAIINISGGTVVAESIASDICTSQTDASQRNCNVSAGNAIGGGVGTKGGDATVIITGGDITATAIGGGTGKASANNKGTGNGGNATVYISGGKVVTGTIGGGTTEESNAKIGYARAYISGGDIQGQFLLQGKITKNNASEDEQLKDRCEFIMTGGKIHDTSATDVKHPMRLKYGGAVYMDDQYGVVAISGGSIKDCDAKSGGAVYMTGGTFTLTGNGTIENCTATGGDDADKDGRGGAVYLGGGRAIVGIDRKLSNATKETIDDIKYNIGTVSQLQYLGLSTPDNNGKMTTINLPEGNSIVNIDDLKCTITNCTATYGGALYVSGNNEDNGTYNEQTGTPNKSIDPQEYNVYISGGSIKENTANINGGGVCVNNGHVLMDGGSVDGNVANNGNGGGLYLSSKATKDARVRIRNGSITNNKANGANGNGGAIAVEGNEDSNLTLKVTIGVNETHYNDNETLSDTAHCDHINDGDEKDDVCPIIKGNYSKATGGAIYITGGENTYLNIYCLEESGNKADNDKDSNYDQSNFLMIKGGTVVITTGDKQSNLKADEGNSVISGTMHIVGGSLDIYGHMKNPQIDGMITVDLQSENDHFEDHRVYIPEIDGEKIYTIQYVENFPLLDENGEPKLDENNQQIKTGRFREFAVKASEGYEHRIIASLFDREDYVIQGWNTESDGTGNWYPMDKVYQFDDTEGRERTIQTHKEDGEDVSDLTTNEKSDSTELTTLKIYAIWGGIYTVRFDPNTTKYEGAKMKDMTCTMGGKYNLTANTYIRPNYVFKEWNLVKDGSGTGYKDKASFKNLGEDGSVVIMYAQWEECKHKTDEYDHLKYRVDPDNPNTIIEECICGGHKATATINANNVKYDGNVHLATISYSTEWLGCRGLDKEISYKYKDESETNKKLNDLNNVTANWTEWTSDSKPIHAGEYTATISVTGTYDNEKAEASTDYEITRIKWDTPVKPAVDKEIKQNQSNVIKITNPLSDEGSKIYYEYTMSYENPITNSSTVTWQTDVEFEDNSYHNIYYFAVRQKEDRNHEQSDPSKALLYLTSNGIVINIDWQEGFTVKIEELDATDENGETLMDSERNSIKNPKFTVGLEEGYHYRDYNNADDFTITYQDKKSVNLLDQKTIKKESKEDTDKGTYSYTITGLEGTEVSGATIDIYIQGVAKDASISAKSIYGQVFVDFNNVQTDISRDSAFTTQFTVNDYYPDEYKEQILKFGQVLPKDSTIIMKVDGGYWYYIVNENSDSIKLTEFISMGNTNKYGYQNDNKDEVVNIIPISFTYQFIVDFSQVKDSDRLSTGELTVDLQLEPKVDNNKEKAPWIPWKESPSDSSEHQLIIVLEEVAGFELTASDNNDETASLNAAYTPSKGKASIWNGRNTSLVLDLAEDSKALPKDIYLEVQVNNSYARYYRNGRNQFIIPLSTVGNSNINITLCSSLFPKDGASYQFNAKWYVSDSSAGDSPLNGDNVASCNIIFNVPKSSVASVKIKGDNHLVRIGKKIETTINYLDVPEDATVSAVIQRKSGDTYVTAVSQETLRSAKTADNSVSTEGAIKYKHEMGDSHSSGSYRLLVTVSQNGVYILQVPYYFILLDSN